MAVRMSAAGKVSQYRERGKKTQRQEAATWQRMAV